MVRFRKAAALVLTLLVTVLSSAPKASAIASAVAMPLSGVVRDDLGKVIDGVEVLILAPEGQGNQALLTAVTDAAGRFAIASLAPGVYRVAAIKTGYMASLSRVNTVLRSTVDLVLRPIPREGEPGSEAVLEDLSWALRVPTRSILREVGAGDLVASRATGGVRAFANRVQESVRGEVDQMFAFGSVRGGTSGAGSNVEGNETRMRFAGSLGERGAIQLRGRRGSLGSSAPSVASRGVSDIDVDVSYATAADENLAMRAFYSAGAISAPEAQGVPAILAKQSQRSFGYDATWRRQLSASAAVALEVAYHDSTLDVGDGTVLAWEPAGGEASNRGIGATASYDDMVGDGHLLRFAVRAQRLNYEAPALRVARGPGGASLEGSMGWNILVDTEDQWSVGGPAALTYGVAVRQGWDGSEATTVTPRVGGVWTGSRLEGRVAVSYFSGARDARGGVGPAETSKSPIGYEMVLKTRLDPTVTLSGITSYVPSRADVVGPAVGSGFDHLYVSDGFASDRFVAVELERVASSAAIAVRLARGQADGALAPSLDETPIAFLAERSLDYDAARVSVKAPRAGSAVSLGYWLTRSRGSPSGAGGIDLQRVWDMQFSQDLVRFAGGRASCRLLVTARAALRPDPSDGNVAASEGGLYGAQDKRAGAGVSVAF